MRRMCILAAATVLSALALLPPAVCLAQTPSPLQEWQYSGGVILARLFEPDVPKYRTVLGLAAEVQPAYDGSRVYHLQGGPVINIQHRDDWFITTGDGIGYNFLRGAHYQIGAAITYDLGRKESADYGNLRGMGDISAAPVGKLYATWVLSRRLPLIVRIDARQFAGGAQGAIGDAAIYTPLPGSSKRFVMFAGPSISVASRHYMQTLYGVTPGQSLASGHPVYEIDRSFGTSAVGVGFSATAFLTSHLLLNLDAALNQIRGAPAHSPLIERRTQRAAILSMAYMWGTL